VSPDLVGKYASFYMDAWANYALKEAKYCLTFDSSKLNFRETACSYVNPLTALGMFHTVTSMGTKRAMQTAASSNVARIFIKLCQVNKITVINIVRRQASATMLEKELNQKYVPIVNDLQITE